MVVPVVEQQLDPTANLTWWECVKYHAYHHRGKVMGFVGAFGGKIVELVFSHYFEEVLP